MRTYTFDQMLDSCYGERGTAERERYEMESEAFIRDYELGEAIRGERERQSMTQRELSEKAGIGESTLSKIENGRGTSMTSLSRIFRALGINDGFLNLGRLGRVTL